MGITHTVTTRTVITDRIRTMATIIGLTGTAGIAITTATVIITNYRR
jgi:hypothetical protein